MHNNFIVPSALTAFTHLLVVLCFFLFKDDYGVEALAYSILTIHSIELAILLIFYRSRTNLYSSLNFSKIKPVIHECKWLGSAALLFYSTQVIDQSMASSLGTGSMSSLSFGTKIVNFINAIFASGLGVVLIVFNSESIAKKEFSEAYNRTVSLSAITMLFGFIVSVFIFIFSEFIIEFVYFRGEFLLNQALVVDEVQKMFAWQIPFFITSTVGVRLLNAKFKAKVNLIIVAINFIINIIGNFVLMKAFGVAGIALSTTLVYASSCIMVFAYLYYLKREERNE